MVKVFVTVDTEVWPQAAGWPHAPLSPHDDCRREIECYLWGGESALRLGLQFQLQILKECGLRANFFVDPFFSLALGLTPLRKAVEAIRDFGHEVALHVHPEWLTDPRLRGLPRFAGPRMSDYPEAVQSEIIAAGATRLGEANADTIHAFRAGSWGANTATLRAVARNGIRIDSSLNACYAESLADLPEREELLHPRQMEGVWEFPQTYFLDRPPDGRRPLQVCAASLAEFRYVLEEAYARHWACVVIVTHSFEFVRTEQLERKGRLVGPRRLLGSRFEAICKYLARHRDRFETALFRDTRPDTFVAPHEERPPASNRARTLARQASQALSLIY